MPEALANALLEADTRREEFRRLVKETRKTGIFITHSIGEAIAISERIVVFRAPGQVAATFRVNEALEEYGEAGLN